MIDRNDEPTWLTYRLKYTETRPGCGKVRVERFTSVLFHPDSERYYWWSWGPRRWWLWRKAINIGFELTFDRAMAAAWASVSEGKKR